MKYEIAYAMNGMFVSSPNSYVEILTPQCDDIRK